MQIHNERGTHMYDIDFAISEREGKPGVGVERVDIRREKTYGIKLTVSGEVTKCADWQLTSRLAGLTARHAQNLGQAISPPGGYVRSNCYSPSVSLTAFISADSPKRILDSSHLICTAVILKMIVTLKEAFAAAVAEHEAAVAKEVDAHTADIIVRWASKEIAKEAEQACDFNARLKALEEERRAKIEEIAATKNREEWIRSSVNVPDAVSASERAIKTALAHLDEYIEAKKEAATYANLFFGAGKELGTGDLVE
jgi:ribosomal protein S13